MTVACLMRYDIFDLSLLGFLTLINFPSFSLFLTILPTVGRDLIKRIECKWILTLLRQFWSSQSHLDCSCESIPILDGCGLTLFTILRIQQYKCATSIIIFKGKDLSVNNFINLSLLFFQTGPIVPFYFSIFRYIHHQSLCPFFPPHLLHNLDLKSSQSVQ